MPKKKETNFIEKYILPAFYMLSIYIVLRVLLNFTEIDNFITPIWLGADVLDLGSANCTYKFIFIYNEIVVGFFAFIISVIVFKSFFKKYDTNIKMISLSFVLILLVQVVYCLTQYSGCMPVEPW